MPLLWVVAAILFGIFLWLAVAASSDPTAPASVAWFLWALTAAAVAFAAAVAGTYTEINADGLVVRTTLSRRTIDWSDLAEVRWQRYHPYDQLVFGRRDGRDIRAAGLVVAATGWGQTRVRRALAEIDQAWSEA
jgi:hypothetical protein